MRLNERIRKAFDAVHAEEELKESTRRSVMRQLERRHRPWLSTPRIVKVLTVLILMIGLGGYFSYFTEASVISVDIDPSIELSVNIYGRVISATGINEDGEALLADVSVDHMDYADAIADLLNSEAVQALLEDGEQPEITVVCGSMQRARAMEDCLSQRVSSASIHCSENHHEVEQAHEAGLSVGRYRLLLELQKQDPNITADDIAGLSMAQIRAMLEATDTEAASPGHHQGHAHHGQDE